jgi:hypothetical protein
MSGSDVGPGDDADLARLGQAFDDELRAEAEEYEALAAKDLLRRRDLGAVARELLHRGDRVAVTSGGRTFTGVVVHAAGDLACLETAGGVVDVRLGGPVAIRVVEVVRTGGLPSGRGAGSFVARLHEHEAAGVTVELGCAALDSEPRGRLAAVASDHVVLDAESGRSYVALAAIGWARPLAP